MISGFYYEFISFPYGYRYSMPLGILWSKNPTFKVYNNTRLYSILRDNLDNELFNLLLLSPIDPKLYYFSLIHDLEKRINYHNGEHPILDKELGAWYLCKPTFKDSRDKVDIYECKSFKHLIGSPPPYSRAMGCFVELLVVYTKVMAGVKPPFHLKSYLEGLNWCIHRSSPNDKDLQRISINIINRIINENYHL
ncbi:MAG: DUF447 family protein [Desulfurococcales archaeon]|nr:DUF447 family protein [Desulfurococcales archaeon]